MASASEEDIINRLSGVNSPECFDTRRFVNQSEMKSSYICPVGQGVLNIPVIVPCCGNAFCKFCIMKCRPWNDGDVTYSQQETSPNGDDMLHVSGNVLKCPNCRKEFEADKLVDVSLNFKNTLGELRIRCSFDKCQKDEPLENILHHEVRCNRNPEREVTCPDCNKNMKHSTLEDHCCKERVLRKFNDVKKKTTEIKQEAHKQIEILENILSE